MAMLVPVLVMTRQVTLSCAGGEKWCTGCPSISKRVSPGRRPAFQAGPDGSTQPTVVEVSAPLVGFPTPQTMTAKNRARAKLNSGPANATMILSRGDTLGSGVVAASSGLPSMASMVAICGRAT